MHRERQRDIHTQRERETKREREKQKHILLVEIGCFGVCVYYRLVVEIGRFGVGQGMSTPVEKRARPLS